MVHKIWIFKEKHVFILYYFVLIKAGKGLNMSQNKLNIAKYGQTHCQSYVKPTGFTNSL